MLEDTFGENKPPFMRVRIIEDEMTLPLSDRTDDITEMNFTAAIYDKDKNWKDEIVTLHFRCNFVDNRNGPYHFWVISSDVRRISPITKARQVISRRKHHKLLDNRGLSLRFDFDGVINLGI